MRRDRLQLVKGLQKNRRKVQVDSLNESCSRQTVAVCTFTTLADSHIIQDLEVAVLIIMWRRVSILTQWQGRAQNQYVLSTQATMFT